LSRWCSGRRSATESMSKGADRHGRHTGGRRAPSAIVAPDRGPDDRMDPWTAWTQEFGSGMQCGDDVWHRGVPAASAPGGFGALAGSRRRGLALRHHAGGT
jgi:hypothetical protein